MAENSLQQMANQFSSLQNDLTLASPTADVDVNARNATANYSGIINVGKDVPGDPAGARAYYGNLNMQVDFSNATTADSVSGTANGFVQYFSEVASADTGSSVPGSLSISGNLTGDNTSGIGSGIDASATGSLDGTNVAYDVDGNIMGIGANGMSLFFSGTNPESTGGVGFAID